MGCGAATVIHLHAVSGMIAPHSTVPMPSAWSSAWPCTTGKYRLGRPSSSLHRTQAPPACRLRSRATPRRSGCGKAPLTAWAAWARVPVVEYHSGRMQGSNSGCTPPASHRHSESGGAAGTVPVCRKWRALLSGCSWRVAARLNHSAAGATGRPPRGLRQGKSWSVCQAWRSGAISSAVPVGTSSGARCHMTASTAHVEKGHARGGVYTWMVHCGRACRCGMRGAPLGQYPPLGPAAFPRALRRSPPPVCRGGPGCARPLLLGPCGRLGRRPPGCSRCRARSHPESIPAPTRSAGQSVRPRAPPRAALRHRGWVGVVAWGTSLPRCKGPVSRQGRGRARCLPAA